MTTTSNTRDVQSSPAAPREAPTAQTVFEALQNEVFPSNTRVSFRQLAWYSGSEHFDGDRQITVNLELSRCADPTKAAQEAAADILNKADRLLEKNGWTGIVDIKVVFDNKEARATPAAQRRLAANLQTLEKVRAWARSKYD